MRTLIGATLLVELLCATTLSAQDSLHVREGQRIRVSTHSAPEWQIGTVVSHGGDTLLVNTGEVVRIPRSEIAQLDTSTGEGHSGLGAIGGATLGLVVGGLGGALVGKFIVSRDRAHNNCPDGDCELVNLLTIPVGAVIGAISGAIIGSEVNSEHWNPVPLYLTTGVGPRGSQRFTIQWQHRTSWLDGR